MLVFIDESYQVRGQKDVWTALAAVCMPRENSRQVALEIFNLKKRFWKVRGPDEVELKGQKLLNPRAIELPKNRDFLQQLVSLCRVSTIVPFAVAQRSSEGLELARLKETGHLPDLHRGILRRVRALLEASHPDRKGLLFFDEREPEINRRISRAFRAFLFRSKEGQSMQQIVETPFFYDSRITPAGQIADIVAYVMCARYAGRRGDAKLEAIFRDFRELTHNAEGAEEKQPWKMWGFSALGAPEEHQQKKEGIGGPEGPWARPCST